MREYHVEQYFCEQVTATGGIVRKVMWIGRRGAPDRWCGWPLLKRAGWVELKHPKTPSAKAHQAREHERMRSCGERVDVLATIEAVDAYIKEMMT